MKLAYSQFMPNRYEIAKDLSDRLDGTIVRYKGVPYRAKCKFNGMDETDLSIGLVRLVDVQKSGAVYKYIKPDDVDLDISMLESLYINHPYIDSVSGLEKIMALWVTSSTSKTFKSGTFPSYAYSDHIDGSHNSHIPTEYVFWTQQAEENIMGIYPDVDPVLLKMASLKREKYEVAVSQRVALRRESIGLIKIFIEGHLVGWIDPDTGKAKITNDDRRWAIQRILDPLGFKL